MVTPLARAVAQVLRIAEGKLDVEAPLTSLGMDSLMGLELRNRIEAALGITVPATLLWTYPTVAALSGHLEAEMAPHPREALEPSTESEADARASAVGLMEKDDLMSFLDGVFERANKGASR